MVDLLHNPDPNNIAIYEKEYNQNALKMVGDSIVLFPIVTDHMYYNGFESNANREHFYKNSYTLGWYNTKSGVLKPMFNRTSIYRSKKYLANYKSIKFDVGNDNIYYSFEADDLIYSYSLADGSIVSFGCKGVGMQLEGREVKSLKESDNLKKMDYGYYSDIKYEPITQVLFRSVCRGKNSSFDGLQVYKDGTLMAEYDVPYSFDVIGYIAPYYYGYGKLENSDGSMDIYRFKL